jgi:hypothetical protein
MDDLFCDLFDEHLAAVWYEQYRLNNLEGIRFLAQCNRLTDKEKK